MFKNSLDVGAFILKKQRIVDILNFVSRKGRVIGGHSSSVVSFDRTSQRKSIALILRLQKVESQIAVRFTFPLEVVPGVDDTMVNIFIFIGLLGYFFEAGHSSFLLL